MSRKNPKSTCKVGIVIVHYNKFPELVKCLSSFKKFPLKFNHQIIVVDNGNNITPVKEKKLKSITRKVNVVKSDFNLGYGDGNNLGAKHVDCEYLLVLNPDTQLKDDSLIKLVKFLDQNKKCFAVSPNLSYPNGVLFIELGSRKLTPIRGIVVLSILNKIFPNSPITKKYWMYDTPHEALREVDVLPGTCFLIRKKVFESLDGFDKRFFLYFEESDLFKRLKDKYKHAKLYVNPDVEIIHDWQPATPGTLESQAIFAKSRFYYFKKHYGLFWAIMVNVVAKLSKWHLLALGIGILVLVVSLLT